MAILSSAIINPSKQKLYERFARFGYISKGIVYCLLGILAVLAALGLNRDKANKTEAFKVIYDQPFGKVLLALIVVGLLGYIMLRIFQAFRDTDNKGNDMKGIATRTGYAISALIYSGLGLYAGKLIFKGSGGSGDSRQFLVSKVLSYPAGEWIIGIIALIIIGSGIHQIIKGISGKFMKKIQLTSSNMTGVFKKAGMVGYISRGVVLIIIGYLLLHAAIASNPSEAQGTDGAFEFIQNTFGSWLMAIVAIGLVGYGVFMFVKAKYERVSMPS